MRHLIAIAVAVFLAWPAMAQAPRIFVVFFEEWSAAFNDPARALLNNVAAVAKANQGAKVIVTGFADLTGNDRANALISSLRAEVVADYLITEGVSADRVERLAKGGTGFVLDSQESRRVTIRIGGN